MTNAANGFHPKEEPDHEPTPDPTYDTEYGDTEDYEAEAAPSRGRKTVLIAALSIVLVLAVAIGGGIWYFMDMTEDDGLIYDNVFAAGIDLSGMTEDEASAALHRITDTTYTQQSLTVTLPDTQLVLAPADTGAQLDVDKLVADAFAYGRSGNRWENFQAKTSASLSRYDLEVLDYLTLDTAYIRQAVDALAQEAQSTLTQPAVTVTGDLPDLARTYEAAIADSSVVHRTMTILIGTPERSLDADGLYGTILAAYAANDFSGITAEYHVAEPEDVDLQALFDEYCVAPVDAALNEEDYTVTAETLGYGFDLEAAQALLDEAEYGQELTIEFAFIEAEVTMMDLEEYLFQDKLASFSSDHVYNPNRTTNLELACKAIDGTIIGPGEVFSFNDTVGQRTADKGYKSAAVYVGSETTDQLGGGICQVASTIYYVALMADMEIVERAEHKFLVTYVPMGMDATIYWGSFDFKFRNSSGYPLRIDASTHDGQVHISFYGTDDKDYYVKMTYEQTGGPYYSADETEEVPENNNPKGYSDGQVIRTAYTGYSVKTYRNKYDKATDKLLSTEYEDSSDYDSRGRVIVKILREETEPSTAPPTTEPPTEAPSTEPPTTEPPTEAPSTDPPTTEPPTEAPSTESPTEAPTDGASNATGE